MVYPNISETNNSYSYIDRYRYGIKFKFVISGVMGDFNVNNFTHLTSGIVLLGLSGSILSTLIVFSKTRYGKYYKKLKYTQKSNPRLKKYNENIKINTSEKEVRKRKNINSISKWIDNIYLESESSFDYSENESDIPKEES